MNTKETNMIWKLRQLRDAWLEVAAINIQVEAFRVARRLRARYGVDCINKGIEISSAPLKKIDQKHGRHRVTLHPRSFTYY